MSHFSLHYVRADCPGLRLLGILPCKKNQPRPIYVVDFFYWWSLGDRTSNLIAACGECSVKLAILFFTSLLVKELIEMDW